VTLVGTPDIALAPDVDLGALGFDAGAHLLVKVAVAQSARGSASVIGSAPGWDVQLASWCRAHGLQVEFVDEADRRRAIVALRPGFDRWRGVQRTGALDPAQQNAVASVAEASWGLAARGAGVEAGSPEMHFRLHRRDEVWADDAATLYAQAVAAQWNPEAAIAWDAAIDLPEAVEEAVVQVMTYLVENENAALVIPARFLGELHPHYREVQALLAIQIADEARHIDVFTRRIALRGRGPGLSTGGGQASLKTLLDETDFSTAALLLSVLGEGTFVNLLTFLNLHAPDPVTRQIARLVARDEARHVAFGMMHLAQRLRVEPDLRVRLARAVEARHEALTGTAGLNEEVFDALILLAAGRLEPAAIAQGFGRVQTLLQEMADGRQARLRNLGFDEASASRMSSLHTRNFM
jgi:hypothetical protein